MGELWNLIEGHRDAQQFPPSYRAIAQKLGVSQGLFATWKNPKSLPSKENLINISRLVGVPYRYVLDAALIDTGYQASLRDEEGGGGHVRSAPITEAGETPAQEDHTLAAYHDEADQPPNTDIGEHSQDPGTDEPA